MKGFRLNFFLLFIVASFAARAQHIAISNNLIFDVMGTFSAGIEIPTAKRASLDLYGSIRPWKRGERSVHKHWTLQAQYRFWPCQVMNGFFWGPYAHASQYNVANKGVPFKFFRNLKSNRYEGWLVGGGIGIGYEYVLSKHWNLSAEIGAGYTYIDYKKNGCEVCGRLVEDAAYHYWGVSRLGLSVLYVF